MSKLAGVAMHPCHAAEQIRPPATHHVKKRQNWEDGLRTIMQVYAGRNDVEDQPFADDLRSGNGMMHPAENDAQFDHLIERLKVFLTSSTARSLQQASETASAMLKVASCKSLTRHAEYLSKACFYFFEVGQSTIGISFGKQILLQAQNFGNIPIQRRISNILGAQYCDIADFASAMQYLEVALKLAKQLEDPLIEAACLANVIAVLQEMGNYRQAIAMSQRLLKLDDDSDNARLLKLQCTSNGLFAAHRIGDIASAAGFLREGQRYLSQRMEPFRRAFFERGRALYLVDLGKAKHAKAHLEDTIASIGSGHSVRIQTLLAIASAVCDWGIGNKGAARENLEKLHCESKSSRLYHHFVLQALIKVYSDAETPLQANVGLTHAHELVEFTTSVKKAKFYRQLANRREETEQRQSAFLSNTSIDPFVSVRDWLSASDVLAPGELAAVGPRVLTKHEELTVIHEDMAKLRVKSLRREIRTDAVNTAENWAIAAEFFDDETGKHCYRVGHLASMLARGIGLEEDFCIRVEHAARLHDIGKIAVNEVILLKPGPLDASEMAAMRLHTEVGAQILSGSDDPTLIMAVEVARYHHEWWNGAGYPKRLSGNEIPISARVCAYADVYDALTHARAYKKAWSHERALEEIVRLGGTQFDPALMEPFCNVLERYRADLATEAIPAFADMDSNALIVSRKKLMETIGGN